MPEDNERNEDYAGHPRRLGPSGRSALPATGVARLTGVLAFLLGGVILIFGVYTPIAPALRTAGWDAADCVITSSEVDVETRTEPWGNHERTFTIYTPRIEYEYTAAGETRASRTIALKDLSGMEESEALRMVRRFPEGAETRCWVNPENPDEAVLVRAEVGIEVWAFGAVGVMLLLFSAVIFARELVLRAASRS